MSRHTPASVGVTAANPAMMSRAMSLRVVISAEAVGVHRAPSVLVGDGLGEPPGREPREVGRQVDAGEPAAELDRGQPGGAAAGERVEHGPAGLAPGGDAPQREVDRVGGEVRPVVGAGGDRPHVAGVAPVRVPAAVAAARRTGWPW